MYDVAQREVMVISSIRRIERGSRRQEGRSAASEAIMMELMEARRIILTQGECLGYICTVALRIYL